MKTLIIGKNSQLAKEFIKILNSKGENFVCLSHMECDITNLNTLQEVFESHKPDIVINCAAYNNVDKAEKEYYLAYKVNALGVYNLTNLCIDHKAFLVHFSTDYVFDGAKDNGLYTENDPTNPVNEYGKSKLTAERWVMESNYEKYLIFRTSWVYGDGKQNFIYKLMQWVKSQKPLKVAYDEISIPTSTHTLANITLKALNQGLRGLYHLTNSGFASRYEWAKTILKIKGIDRFIYPVSKDTFNLPAKRPYFSAMSNKSISEKLNIKIEEWEEELKRIIKNMDY